MIKHILYPTDVSKTAKQLLVTVSELARFYQAQVTVLHGYTHSNAITLMTAYDISYHSIYELQEKASDLILTHLKDTQQKLKNVGVSAHVAFIEGDAGLVIVEYAKQHACDLIVMGTRGLGPVKSFLLGSVSNYVIHHTHVPIMLIPGDEEIAD